MKSGLMLGVNPNAIREENDFYATNPNALKLFLKEFTYLEKSIPIWECACGQGHLSKELINQGYNIKSSDLIDRNYGEVIDFLKYNGEWNGNILTNPPFSLAEEFVEKGMSLLKEDNYLCLFLKIQFLESESRYKLFKEYNPIYIYAHSSRQQCCKDADFDKYQATTQFYCWIIFQKGYSGDTILRWIKPKI